MTASFRLCSNHMPIYSPLWYNCTSSSMDWAHASSSSSASAGAWRSPLTRLLAPPTNLELTRQEQVERGGRQLQSHLLDLVVRSKTRLIPCGLCHVWSRLKRQLKVPLHPASPMRTFTKDWQRGEGKKEEQQHLGQPLSSLVSEGLGRGRRGN